MGDPWAGQDNEKDVPNFECISESFDSRVTFGADPPTGSKKKKL